VKGVDERYCVCPAFTNVEEVTPGDVRRMIEWCPYEDRDLVEVDWRRRELG
jgi:hypothetical protein